MNPGSGVPAVVPSAPFLIGELAGSSSLSQSWDSSIQNTPKNWSPDLGVMNGVNPSVEAVFNWHTCGSIVFPSQTALSPLGSSPTGEAEASWRATRQGITSWRLIETDGLGAACEIGRAHV